MRFIRTSDMNACLHSAVQACSGCAGHCTMCEHCPCTWHWTHLLLRCPPQHWHWPHAVLALRRWWISSEEGTSHWDALPSMNLPWCGTLCDSRCYQEQPHQWVSGSSAQGPQWMAKAHSHSPLVATSGQSDCCIIFVCIHIYMHKQCCIHTYVHTYIMFKMLPN